MDNNIYQTDENGYFLSEEQQSRLLSRSLSGVFAMMFAGLVVSTFAAWFTLSSRALLGLLVYNDFAFYGLMIAELLLVIVLSARIGKMSPVTAVVMFFLYAALNGVTLSFIFLVYELGTIGVAFLSAAGMFGVMAVYGAITKKDMTGIGSFCLMGLFGIIIASLVNLFFRSSTFDLIICYVGILVFLGLTAYDTQKIKRMVSQSTSDDVAKKIMVMGALTLYLDFINIFLKLLRVMGRKRN